MVSTPPRLAYEIEEATNGKSTNDADSAATSDGGVPGVFGN